LDDLLGYRQRQRIVAIGEVESFANALVSRRHDLDGLGIESPILDEAPKWHRWLPLYRREHYELSATDAWAEPQPVMKAPYADGHQMGCVIFDATSTIEELAPTPAVDVMSAGIL
jgi:hypothetical protein